MTVFYFIFNSQFVGFEIPTSCLHIRASKSKSSFKLTSEWIDIFIMYGYDISCRITKGTLKISDKISCLYIDWYTQSTVLANSRVLVSLVNGEWRWQPQQKLVEFIFIPCLLPSVTCPCIHTDPVIAPPRYSLSFASYLGLGTQDLYSLWGRWHSIATPT